MNNINAQRLTSGLGLSWGTKATLKWVQKRVPESQPLPSLAVSFLLTITALWSTHSPNDKGRCSTVVTGMYGWCISGKDIRMSDYAFSSPLICVKLHNWVCTKGPLVRKHNRKCIDRKTTGKEVHRATGSGCSKHSSSWNYFLLF